MTSLDRLAPLLLAAGILLAGNGIQGTLIALRASQEGFGPLLIGMIGAWSLDLTERVWPGSVSLPGDEVPAFGNLLYFAYVTLTTLGYGEITPLSQPADIVTTLLSLTGVFFPAVLIARLVSRYETS